jgi:hypothetical protein
MYVRMIEVAPTWFTRDNYVADKRQIILDSVRMSAYMRSAVSNPVFFDESDPSEDRSLFPVAAARRAPPARPPAPAPSVMYTQQHAQVAPPSASPTVVYAQSQPQPPTIVYAPPQTVAPPTILYAQPQQQQQQQQQPSNFGQQQQQQMPQIIVNTAPSRADAQAPSAPTLDRALLLATAPTQARGADDIALASLGLPGAIALAVIALLLIIVVELLVALWSAKRAPDGVAGMTGGGWMPTTVMFAPPGHLPPPTNHAPGVAYVNAYAPPPPHALTPSPPPHFGYAPDTASLGSRPFSVVYTPYWMPPARHGSVSTLAV